MPERVWQSAVNGVIVTHPTRPAHRAGGETWFELIPIGAYCALRDQIVALLRQETARADLAEDVARIAQAQARI